MHERSETPTIAHKPESRNPEPMDADELTSATSSEVDSKHTRREVVTDGGCCVSAQAGALLKTEL